MSFGIFMKLIYSHVSIGKIVIPCFAKVILLPIGVYGIDIRGCMPGITDVITSLR